MYLGCSFAEFSTPLEVGVMDSEVILQPKQMGHSLVVFFFSLVYTSVHKNSEKM